jgi:ubiquinone/menaquinone biosynthesis C-methylase UbiE
MTEALLAFAAPRPGERVLDIGCGCGATMLEFARAVGPAGRVAALDISGPMLAEGKARAETAGMSNVDWQQADAATAGLSGFDLLTSAFGLMFFGEPVGAFAHVRRAANTGARMAFVCWRQLDENPWMQVPMNAVARHLPPASETGPERPWNVRLRRSAARIRGSHRSGLEDAAARQTRPRSGHRRRPCRSWLSPMAS